MEKATMLLDQVKTASSDERKQFILHQALDVIMKNNNNSFIFYICKIIFAYIYLHIQFFVIIIIIHL